MEKKQQKTKTHAILFLFLFGGCVTFSAPAYVSVHRRAATGSMFQCTGCCHWQYVSAPPCLTQLKKTGTFVLTNVQIIIVNTHRQLE